jgi:capsular polysaccharide transport system permease protein
MGRNGQVEVAQPPRRGRADIASDWRGFRDAMRWQVGVISALLYREAGLRHGKSMRFGFTLMMVEPIIIIGAICLLFYMINRPPMYGSSMVLFVATGVFPVYLFIHTATGIREPVQGAHVGRYPVQLPLDAVMAHVFLRGLSSALIGVLFFAGVYWTDTRQAMPHEPVTALTSLGVIFIMGVGLGVINPVIGRLIPFWDSVWPAISRASLHFAGIYYVADYLPPDIRVYLSFNPLVHAVDWFRTAFYPFYPTLIMNRPVLLYLTLAFVFFSLCLERVFREKLLKGER